MGPPRIWQCHLAAWSRTRLCRRPSGLVPGGVRGMLQVDCVLCGVMCCVVLDLAVAPCWLGQPREFLQEAVWWRASCDDLHTAD